MNNMIAKRRSWVVMKVNINKDVCVGCRSCQDICPRVFQIENDLAKVSDGAVPKEVQGDCYEALENCPVEAITMEEA